MGDNANELGKVKAIAKETYNQISKVQKDQAQKRRESIENQEAEIRQALIAQASKNEARASAKTKKVDEDCASTKKTSKDQLVAARAGHKVAHKARNTAFESKLKNSEQAQQAALDAAKKKLEAALGSYVQTIAEAGVARERAEASAAEIRSAAEGLLPFRPLVAPHVPQADTEPEKVIIPSPGYA